MPIFHSYTFQKRRSAEAAPAGTGAPPHVMQHALHQMVEDFGIVQQVLCPVMMTNGAAGQDVDALCDVAGQLRVLFEQRHGQLLGAQ